MNVPLLVIFGTLAVAGLKPPVIHEVFSPLGCPAHPLTTEDIEGCAERQILRTDRQINAQVQTIFELLSAKGRPPFVAGELSWERYRRSSCTAEAANYAGGSIEPVIFADCVAARNRAHLADLREMRLTVAHH